MKDSSRVKVCSLMKEAILGIGYTEIFAWLTMGEKRLMLNDLNISVEETSRGIKNPDTSIDLDNTRIVPCADVHCTVLEGEAVLLHLKNGHYYTLNRIGTVTWELFDGKQTLKDVHRKICARFEVKEDKALKDLMVLVNRLGQEGLIQQERG